MSESLKQECTLMERWDYCLKIIHDNVTEQAYQTWFMPIKPLVYEGKTLQIEVPSKFFYEFIEEKYLDLLSLVLNRGFGEGTQLVYKIQTSGKKTSEEEVLPSNGMGTGNVPTSRRDPRLAPTFMESHGAEELDSQLKPEYTFESFIEGNSNKLPRVAAEAVAKNPGKTPFNPLFIYGQSGFGKTHLVNAIGNKIKATSPHTRVLYISAHLFQVQYTDSVRNNKVNDFIRFYQTVDVLIIDDVQEFAGLTKTQNTFFHIFNQLHQNGKQLILTSDRSPVMLQGMEDRLLTRFKWGLLAELERPSTELRKKILKNKMYRDGLKLPEDVVDYIAEHVSESVRDLEGIVNSLMAYSVVYNRDIDLDFAECIVKKVTKVEQKQLTVEGILDKVCGYFDMDIAMVQSRSRKRNVVQARQIAMYLSKKHTDASFSQIGSVIGKKDHATVVHSCKMVRNLLDVDKELRASVEAIEAELKHL